MALGVLAALLPFPAWATCEGLLPGQDAPSHQRRPVTADDLLRLRDIGQPDASTFRQPTPLAVSPDGREVAFVLTRADPERNTHCSALAVVPADGTAAPRFLADAGELIVDEQAQRGSIVTIGSPAAVRPRWSPDGRWIAFLRREHGHTRLWRVAAQGGAPLAVSPIGEDVVSFAFSEDGRRLILATRPTAELRAAIEHDGRDGWRYDEHIVPYMGTRPQIPAGLPLELSAVNPASGVVLQTDGAENAILEKTARDDAATSAVAGDGRRVSAEPRDERPGSLLRLVVDDADGGREVCDAPACDGAIFGLWWNADGQEAWYLRREGWNAERTALYRWRPGSGTPTQVLQTIDVLLGCLPASGKLVCLHESSATPRRLVSVDPATGEIRNLYDPNPEFGTLVLGNVERLRWRNDRGLEAWGDLVLPADYRPGVRLPLIVVQYHSDGFLRGGTGDEYPIFAFAARGFAVLSIERPAFVAESAPNVRTSEEFNAANARGWAERRSLLSSLLTGVAMVVERGIADPERIGLSGLSDGASSARFALINSDAFAAASISSCCVDAQTTMIYAGTVYADQSRARGYPPLTRPDPDFWRPYSLALNAERLGRPLLMQVPEFEFILALETFAALREHGQPVELFVFPDEFHMKWQPAHRRAIYERNLDWFAYWLQDQEDPAPAKEAQYRRWKALRSDRHRRAP